MKTVHIKKSILNYFEEKFNFKFQTLNFRFPIETLDTLLKKFYKEYDQAAFLVQANKNFPNLVLKKISKSYLLKVPLEVQSNEHLYIGLSDLLSFLVLFDEPNLDERSFKEQKSRFFLTFDPKVIKVIFDYFYENYCQGLSLKEKKLLIKLKNSTNNQLNPSYISKFQEALLINALNVNNKLKQSKIIEALSFTDESIAITDLAGNVLESNKNFEKQFESATKKKTIKDLLPESIFSSALSETTRKNKWQAEINLNIASGKLETLCISCYLFKDDLERPTGFVFTFKDITELKKLDNLNKQLITKLREQNIQLSEVNKRLIEADRIKSDLLSVVSHELKTPVSTIIGFSELIANRKYDETTVRQFAEQINDSGKKLDKIISDYLDVASNQFGISVNKLHTMPLNLVDLIRHCYKEQKAEYNNSNLAFEINCLGYEPIIISEAQNMQKLFSNLINNSLKYSPNGGKILVKILNDGENVTVSVTDQGVGMTTEQISRVFEPFYRTDNSLTREFPGIGLGLATCKKVVELYNGSIWCEPGVDVGTVFYVTLPVNPSKPQERKLVEPGQKSDVQTSTISSPNHF
ncbi:MAG: PAS domain-containing sensor histidine kinase [Candidatus Melainabacteria bacterium]|nr:PAS domain-containing sensor histidine kinase [Candidatus Melainabacteria bacterium]